LCNTAAASKLLQKVEFDIADAYNCIDDIIKTIQNKRTNYENIFHSIFEEIKTVIADLDIDIKLPRKIKRQTHLQLVLKNIIDVYCLFLFLKMS